MTAALVLFWSSGDELLLVMLTGQSCEHSCEDLVCVQQVLTDPVLWLQMYDVCIVALHVSAFQTSQAAAWPICADCEAGVQ